MLHLGFLLEKPGATFYQEIQEFTCYSKQLHSVTGAVTQLNNTHPECLPFIKYFHVWTLCHLIFMAHLWYTGQYYYSHLINEATEPGLYHYYQSTLLIRDKVVIMTLWLQGKFFPIADAFNFKEIFWRSSCEKCSNEDASIITV